MTVRHVGGGHKRRYRVVDFRRDKDGIPAKVFSVEYDPNRSSRIALLHYADGEKRYILAPNALRPGDSVESGPGADIKPGNAMGAAPDSRRNDRSCGRAQTRKGRAARAECGNRNPADGQGWESKPCSSCRPVSFARSDSNAARRSARSGTSSTRTSSSGRRAGSAGWDAVRAVRGMAMNPVDHPHGGGEGRAKGNHPQTPWGKPTKGYKTRRNKSSDKYIVARRSRK